MISRLVEMVRSALTRGQVQQAAIQARTIVQVQGLGETLNGIELLLPPGYSARPGAGADVVLLQILGTRDHVVALGGDMAHADGIADLAPGELGLRNAGANIQLVLRNSGVIEISGNLAITGNLTATGTISAGVGSGDQVGLTTHTHPVNGATTEAPTGGT